MPTTPPLIHYLESLSAQLLLKLQDVSVYKVANLAYVVFNMEDRTMNVMNLRLMPQFEKVFEGLKKLVESKRVGVVVFCSGKPDSFIAGADIDMLYPTTDPKEIREMAKRGQEGFNKIMELGVPSVCAINGVALGAGCEIGLACTYRVCADSKKVSIGLPEVKLGLLPGSGGTVRLSKIIGLQEALKIILPGGAVNAKKAKKIGLVDKVIPSFESFPGQHTFWRGVTAFAKSKLWGKPTRVYTRPNKTWGDYFLNSTSIGNWMVGREAARGLDKMAKGRYPGPYFALDSTINAVSASHLDAEKLEAKYFGKLGGSSQSKALISLFKMMEGSKKFQEKCGGEGISPKKVGIVGAGVMGSQIAVLCAKKGLKVYIRDIKQQFVDKGVGLVASTFNAQVAKKRMSQEKANSKIALVTGGTGVEGFRDCDLIIEAAVELMPLKKKIFKELEKVTKPECVLATNTSSLSITELASVLENPSRCVGIHFFNPVGKMPLVEVIRCPSTSHDMVATGYRFALKLGKVPVICNDCPGFVVNRILGIYMGEAVKLAMEGCKLPFVDDALLEFGMPMGPFRLMDEVGLDVAAHVAPVLENGLGERYKSDPRYAELIKSNPQFLGKKTGAGFYKYNAKGKQGPLNSVFVRKLNNLVTSNSNASKKAIKDRCVMVMLNEACMILEENMVNCPEDLDLAMVMGTGFAPFTGGLLSYADFRGIPSIVKRMEWLEKRCGTRFKPHKTLVKMAKDGTRFFPDRPDPKKVRQIPIKECPRSKL